MIFIRACCKRWNGHSPVIDLNQGGPAVPTHSLGVPERSWHVNHQVAGPAVRLPPLQSTRIDRVGYRCKDITQEYL